MKMELRRPEQGQPTEVGFHYAIPKGWKDDACISPIMVKQLKGTDKFFGMVGDQPFDVEKFRWFGPVPTCVAATLP